MSSRREIFESVLARLSPVEREVIWEQLRSSPRVRVTKDRRVRLEGVTRQGRRFPFTFHAQDWLALETHMSLVRKFIDEHPDLLQ